MALLGPLLPDQQGPDRLEQARDGLEQNLPERRGGWEGAPRRGPRKALVAILYAFNFSSLKEKLQ